MWKYYNPNPCKKNVGDCVVRALTKALDSDLETVFAGLTVVSYALSDMPSANHVWGAYLRKMGFKRYIVDDYGLDGYTVDDFCKDNKKGTFVLAIPGHVVCVVDGDYYDTWDSGDEIPQYYWTK